MTPSNPASTMAKKPKSSADAEATQAPIVGLAAPRLDPSAARALAKAQAKLGYAPPPIVARSIQAEPQPASPPAEPPQQPQPPGAAGSDQ